MQGVNGINPLADDLEAATRLLTPVWKKLSGASLFITGGTGFFGRWLLETLAWANETLDVKVRATVLSRNPSRFLLGAPHLGADAGVDFVSGDVATFDFPASGFDFVLHAATDTTNLVNLDATYQAITGGTRRVLELAVQAEASMLYVSSGAVYGRRASAEPFVSESTPAGPAAGELPDAYRDGKRAAEELVRERAAIARCFAFHGPHLPLDAHYAIGNFLADRLAGRNIEIKGDGAPLRSYLYASDLAVWLWTILAEAQPGQTYNVGSGKPISIGELGNLIGNEFEPKLAVHIAQTPEPGKPAAVYVPNVEKAKAELGLDETVTLREGLARTLAWLRA